MFRERQMQKPNGYIKSESSEDMLVASFKLIWKERLASRGGRCIYRVTGLEPACLV